MSARTESRETGRSAAALCLIAAALYLPASYTDRHHWDEYFYLYSALHHTPAELAELEPRLIFFNDGFFTAKAGLLLLLRGLLALFGTGLGALVVMQLLFALMMAGFVLATFGLVREVFAGESTRAARIAAVAAFLPVTLYLGHKTLAEPPSLLLVTLASWSFLRAFRASAVPGVIGWLVITATGLVLGAATRYTALFGFAGLVAGLLALNDPRYPRRRVLTYALILGAVGLLVAELVTLTAGVPLARLLTPALTVAEKAKVSAAHRIYAAVLTVQLFGPFVLLALGRGWSGRTRFATAWLAVAGLPFTLGHEPRYYFAALVPLAILAEDGLERLATRLDSLRRGRIWVALLVLLAAGDRILFAPLEPYEVEQREYARFLADLTGAQANGTVLLPWVSDFCFARLALPHRSAKLVYGGPEIPEQSGFRVPTPEFLNWVEPGGYLGSRASLAAEPPPWLYVGWTYSPVVLRLQALLGAVDLPTGFLRKGLRNHLEVSWLWTDPTLARHPAGSRGRYVALELKPTAEAGP